MSVLEIRDLHVTVDADGGPREILRGVDLTVRQGETHAIMGPNGSGKSTLAYSIAGHPKYTVTQGSVTLDGADVLAMTRRRSGPAPACSWRCSTRSRSPASRCPTSCGPRRPPSAARRRSCAPGSRTSTARWTGSRSTPRSPTRNVNEGFSGGEKKRHEILQLELLQAEDRDPRRDRLRARRRRAARSSPRASTGSAASGEVGVLLITHYTRILRYITPDFVHVFAGGRIVEEGGPELADQLETEGYERFAKAAARDHRHGHAPSRASSGPRGLDVAADQGRLPDPVAHGPRRAAAGLPRQRRHLAEAAPGARRRARRSTSSTTPPCTAARTSSPRRRPTPTRAPARRSPRSSARRADEIVFTKNATEGINLVAYSMSNAATPGRRRPGSSSGPATRSSSPRWSTTPTSCRGSMLAPAHRRDAALARR